MMDTQTTETKSKKKQGPWPHGKPTIECDRCHGVGLDPIRVQAYERSREHVDDDRQRMSRCVCERCSGRGRIIGFGVDARV